MISVVRPFLIEEESLDVAEYHYPKKKISYRDRSNDNNKNSVSNLKYLSPIRTSR